MSTILDPSPSRRAFLKLAAAAPALAIVPVAPDAAAAPALAIGELGGYRGLGIIESPISPVNPSVIGVAERLARVRISEIETGLYTRERWLKEWRVARVKARKAKTEVPEARSVWSAYALKERARASTPTNHFGGSSRPWRIRQARVRAQMKLSGYDKLPWEMEWAP